MAPPRSDDEDDPDSGRGSDDAATGDDSNPGSGLWIPETATEEEAAAIAAAIGSYLVEERAATADGDRGWTGRRWSFAGRLERVTGCPVQVPDGAPTDAWRAAERADRY